MRQLRVQPNSGCQVSELFAHIFPECYGRYEEGFTDKSSYPPRFVPTYLSLAYEFMDDSETLQTVLEGTATDYPGGGFVMDWPNNMTETLIMLDDLRDWAWCDRATRAIVVELNALNLNVNVLVNTRIVFEMDASGTVAGDVKSKAAPLFFFTPSTGQYAAVFYIQILVTLAFTIYSSWVMFLFLKTCLNFLGGGLGSFMRWLLKDGLISGLKKFAMMLLKTIFSYFAYGWNVCDFFILILFWCHMYYRMKAYMLKGAEKNLAEDKIGHPELFMPFSKVLHPVTQGTMLLSFLAILCWIKLFKYLCLITYFRAFVRILEKCAKSLITFSIMLLTVFIAFAVCFFCGFGGYTEDYSTLQSAMSILFFKMLDGYTMDYRWFEPGQLGIMPFVYFMYVCVLFFVLMFVFMAIVLDVYATSQHLFKDVFDTENVKENPMAVFINVYYQNSVHGKSLVEKHGDTDLSSDVLSIKLDLLPGIVRRKWIEKKRNMQRVANEQFIGLELFPGEEKILLGDTDRQISDWMMPSSKATIDMMADGDANRLVPIYDVPDEVFEQEVSYQQLQRLMDEDGTLRLLLGMAKATEVIRKFKNAANNDPYNKAAGAFDAIRGIQTGVFERIELLEAGNPHEEVPNVPVIAEITEDMSHAIADVRSMFRLQLTGIIEATAALFEHLVELTQGLDAVRRNHEAVIGLVQQSEQAMGAI